MPGLPISGVGKPSTMKSLQKPGPGLFFFKRKFHFLREGVDFLTKNTDYLPKVNASFFLVLCPLLSSKTFASVLTILGGHR